MGDQKDNVKVVIRVRPLNERETQECTKTCVSIAEINKAIALDIKSEQKCFTYDYVASEEATQEEIFEKVGKPITESCLFGYNGTIFAYGQTGAGKTFTILGPSLKLGPDFKHSSEYHKRGLLPRCFEFLFSSIEPDLYNIKCSYLEIYQEQVNDLLNPNPQTLQLREDMKRGVYVEGLIEESVKDVNETYNLLRIGTQNRHVGSTSMNKESSRSHSVFSLVLESRTKDGVVFRRFHLIDLAGSERQKATDCAGERLKEAGMINKSLSALGNVINSLVDISEGKSRHIHYRDSKLTFLLKDSLGGNSKTCLVANISPAFSALNETLSTLKFSQRAKQIKNSAVVNENLSDQVAFFKSEIKKLQEELFFAKEGGFCLKCQILDESKDNVYEILEQTLKSKQEAHVFFTKKQDDHEEMIKTMKNSLQRLENKINHDKMFLKFREATISKLQTGNYEENKEVNDLKKEIEFLKDQIDNNPGIHRLIIENQRLQYKIGELTEEKNEMEGNNCSKGRINELLNISCKLAEALKTTAFEKQELLEKIEKNEENFKKNEENLMNQSKDYFNGLDTYRESQISELQQKIQELTQEKDQNSQTIFEITTKNTELSEKVKNLSESLKTSSETLKTMKTPEEF